MEVLESSITGAFKMILMIVGVLVLLRFLGQLMNAKRNLEEERKMNQRQRALEVEAQKKHKYFGKTRVLGKNQKDDNSIEDINFEEVE
ncbi:hypothetical protein N9089_01300 [Crocinitomicaceae bacterium]|nr:hypothetical protein [Crocinitomicaceae bacterium]